MGYLDFMNDFDLNEYIRKFIVIFIRVVEKPFLMLYGLPWYIKLAMSFIIVILMGLIIFLVFKNKDEWLRVKY